MTKIKKTCCKKLFYYTKINLFHAFHKSLNSSCVNNKLKRTALYFCGASFNLNTIHLVMFKNYIPDMLNCLLGIYGINLL